MVRKTMPSHHFLHLYNGDSRYFPIIANNPPFVYICDTEQANLIKIMQTLLQKYQEVLFALVIFLSITKNHKLRRNSPDPS